MSTIKEIMQIGVGMPDRETFARFSHEILGFPITNSRDGTVTYMRVDRYPYRLAARTAPEPVLNYIAFDVGGPGRTFRVENQARGQRHRLAPRQPGGMPRTAGG